jgi:thiamine pyrophosphokinase
MNATGRKVLVVGAAPAPGLSDAYLGWIRAAEYVIAADAGAALCRAAGRACDLCVGDFDSLDAETGRWLAASRIPLLRFPAEKDASDLDLAVDAARRSGAVALEICAAFHGRIDHTIASFGTLLHAADLEARAVEPEFTAYALDARTRPTLRLAEAPGTTISLFAADPDTTLTVTGVKYPLHSAVLPRYSSLGLSNEAHDAVQLVEISKGRAWCVVGSSLLT